MSFPKPMFRKGGPYKGNYSVTGAQDETHLERLKSLGWHEDKDVALGLAKPVDEKSPATREELEEKAAELGIGFNARTKDDTLAERIAEALGDD